MTVRILVGDALAMLRTLPDESVQCCVTSPPYWGLRDYGVAGQLGLEKTPDEYVERMVEVFSAVRGALAKDGVLWLNIGDSYNAYNGGAGPSSKLSRGAQTTARPKLTTGFGLQCKTLKPKDLIGIPWRLAFALQADGWYLRSDIVWAKPNGMPESVQDRPTRSHEMVFLLSKSERYFYDSDAARTPPTPATETRLAQNVEAQAGSDRGNGGAKTNGPMKAVGRHGSTLTGAPHGRHFLGDAIPEKERRTDKQRGHSRVHAGFNDRWDAMKKDEQQMAGANLRSVWWLATAQFREGHFATMPTTLAEICIIAGSRKGDTVLDPFGGAGSTGLVADRLGRNAVLCELNPEYAAMAEKRLRGDAGMFADVEVA